MSKIITIFFIVVLFASLVYADEAINYYRKGALYYQRGNYEDAVPLFQKAIDLNTNFSQAYHFLGLCYVGLVRFEKASDYFYKALELYRQQRNREGVSEVEGFLRRLRIGMLL